MASTMVADSRLQVVVAKQAPTTTTAIPAISAALLDTKQQQQPPDRGLKRKMSLDAKCPATNGGVSGSGGIATNTIMITNNYSKHGMTPTSTTTTSKSSKITILTHDDDDGEHDPTDPDGRQHHHRPMVVDQINICINNHFSSDAALMTTTTSATAKLPDLIKIQKKPATTSTTTVVEQKMGYEAVVKEEKMDTVGDEVVRIKQEPIDIEEVLLGQRLEKRAPFHKFSIGEEVLVPRQAVSDCFFLGILTVIRDDQCLVQFEDGSNCWSPLGEIKRLLRQPNTIFCVICKRRDATDAAQGMSSTVCLSCGRAYHRACIQTELDKLKNDNEMEEKSSSQNINCLRCFKKDAGIDQIVIATAEAERNDPKGMDKSQDIENNKTNSSNTGNTSSVINQVEIGTPSMDWFTKERKGDEGGGTLGLEEQEPYEEDDVDGDSEAKTEDDYFKYVNGRRLRKRQQKTNYAEKPRRSLGTENNKSTGGGATSTFPSPSWSCSSSTCSTTSSSGWCTSSVMSSFTGSALFSLDELRWAFLPKSRKSKKRNAKKATTAVDNNGGGRQQAQSLKVPYDRATAVAATTRVSSHEGEERERDLKWNSIYETKSRLARGDKYKVRGKRQDHLGAVQYLIEWDSGAA